MNFNIQEIEKLRRMLDSGDWSCADGKYIPENSHDIGKSPIFNRKYIFINGGCSIVMLVFQKVSFLVYRILLFWGSQYFLHLFMRFINPSPTMENIKYFSHCVLDS